MSYINALKKITMAIATEPIQPFIIQQIESRWNMLQPERENKHEQTINFCQKAGLYANDFDFLITNDSPVKLRIELFYHFDKPVNRSRMFDAVLRDNIEMLDIVTKHQLEKRNEIEENSQSQAKAKSKKRKAVSKE